MSPHEWFRRAVGLDQPFEDAERRWRDPPTPTSTNRDPKPLPRSLQTLRERFERELVDAQDRSPTEFEQARERLGVLSPWYAPPTDREVIDMRTAVQRALTAVKTAIVMLERAEKRQFPWYADRRKVPGIEGPLVDEIGPGNAMRGDHDPVPVLLVCRDLLTRYIERMEAARPIADPSVRTQIVRTIAGTLLGAGVATKDICAVLLSKGIQTSAHAVDQVASKLRRTAPQRPRGGAPRGPRKTSAATPKKPASG